MEKSEPMNNIQMLCKDCTKMRRNDWQDHNKDTKIHAGDFVKVELKDGKISEHCWVKLQRVETDGKTMQGNLDNVPIFVKNYKYGDYIAVSRKDIEEYTKGE